MTVYDERRDELEVHEFMMGTERGRLAVSLDVLTDALVLVGQHGERADAGNARDGRAVDHEGDCGREGTDLRPDGVVEERPGGVRGRACPGRKTQGPLLHCLRNGALAGSNPT